MELLGHLGPGGVEHDRERRWRRATSSRSRGASRNETMSVARRCTLPRSIAVCDLVVDGRLELPADTGRGSPRRHHRSSARPRRRRRRRTRRCRAGRSRGDRLAGRSRPADSERRRPPMRSSTATTPADRSATGRRRSARCCSSQGGGRALGAWLTAGRVVRPCQGPLGCGGTGVGRAGCRGRTGCAAARRATARAAAGRRRGRSPTGTSTVGVGVEAAAAEAAAVDLEAARPRRGDADDERDEQQRRDDGRHRA